MGGGGKDVRGTEIIVAGRIQGRILGKDTWKGYLERIQEEGFGMLSATPQPYSQRLRTLQFFGSFLGL
jgi:hypothetical protein